MAKKNALGRGLGALIEDAGRDNSIAAAAINEIPVRDIEANPWQPRTQFDDQSLEELADSIREIGIIQPITVRLMEEGSYQLITGERRFRAAKKLGLKTIPAFVRLAEDQNMLEMALIENIQREDLNAVEVAFSYQRLIEECNLTQETLSDRIGKKRPTVTNYLRLLKLPAEIQLAIQDRKIAMGHARALINLENEEQQIQVCEKIIAGDLSVRAAEELVKKAQSNIEGKPKKEGVGEITPEYQELKSHLMRHFGTNVDFKRNNKGSGKIVIPFRSDEDLERIIAILDKLNAV